MRYFIKPWEIEEIPQLDSSPSTSLRITFVIEEGTEEILPLGRHGVEVTVSWGYELHSVKVSAAKWKRIRGAEAIMIKSIGWYEGKSFQCRWYFDLNAEYTLIVSYGDDGADGYIGSISSASIEERQPKKRE